MARDGYAAIAVPVVLSYGEHDWSRPHERDANARTIPAVQTLAMPACGHFSTLERPGDVARLIHEGKSRSGPGLSSSAH